MKGIEVVFADYDFIHYTYKKTLYELDVCLTDYLVELAEEMNSLGDGEFWTTRDLLDLKLLEDYATQYIKYKIENIPELINKSIEVL